MNDALLAAVLAAPDDDAPRLVLADALLQRGDPWGEIIVISCELARYRREERRWDERGRALVKRLDELQATRFPAAGLQLTFERGFCTEVEVRGGDVRAIDGPAFALFDSLIVHCKRDELDHLAHWPRLAALRKLRIAGSDERRRSPVHVWDVLEAARAVVELELSRVDLDGRGIAALLGLPQVRQLRRLAITANNSLAGMLGGLPWPALEELDLAACSLRREDIEAVLACDALHALRALDISFNSVEDTELADVLARTPWTQLQKLELLGNTVGERGLALLLASAPLAGLTTLAIGSTDGDEDLTGVLPELATALPALRDLHLRSPQATRWLPAIARPYTHLDLELPELDPEDLAALLAQPPLCALRQMWLSLRRPLDPDHDDPERGERLGAVLAAAPLPELASLFLDNCRLGEPGALALARATHLSRELDLICFDEDFGDAAAALARRFPFLEVY